LHFFCIWHVCLSLNCIVQSHFFALFLFFFSSWKYSRTSAIR
jgi:hypothetical protein